jgi:type II secretory pathway component PulK
MLRPHPTSPPARATAGRPAAARRGVVLLAVLVVVSLLALAAYEYADLMASELKAVDSSARAVQAKAAADSGVYFAAAVLADTNAMTSTLNGNPYDASGAFQGVAVGSNDSPKRQARFSVVSPNDVDTTSGSNTGGFHYGVTDESGRLNVNALIRIDPSGTVLHDMLMKLPNMTEEIADAIVDWVDADDTPRANGAENDYYAGLSPPYACKNGPLDSLEELLLVRGVTAQLLFGTDLNRNGSQDPNEPDNGSGFDRGWSNYLTVYSREPNKDSDGNQRIYVNSKDLSTLYDNLASAVSADVAGYLIAYRLYGGTSTTPASSSSGSGTTKTTTNTTSAAKTSASTPSAHPASELTKDVLGLNGTTSTSSSGGSSSGGSSTPAPQPKSLPSLYALINSTVSITTGTGRNQKTTVYASPFNSTDAIKNTLPLLLDKASTRSSSELPARINVNTAPRAVLACLPGLSDTDVQTIIDNRPTPGSTDLVNTTTAWLLTSANLSPSAVQALESYITARTQVYRLQSVGYFDGGGPAARVEAVIDTNNGQPRIIYYRDLSELGRGFDLSGGN